MISRTYGTVPFNNTTSKSCHRAVASEWTWRPSASRLLIGLIMAATPPFGLAKCCILTCIALLAAVPTATCIEWGRLPGECGKITASHRAHIILACASNTCQRTGTWQQSYSRHHASVLLGTAPQKYIAVEGEPSGGLADNLAVITSMLYVAIITGRALLINEQHRPWTAAYDMPNIDWIYSR